MDRDPRDAEATASVKHLGAVTTRPCPCGSTAQPRRHGTIAATWLDHDDGRTIERTGFFPRLRCLDCGSTRMVTAPDMHPGRLMTIAFVDRVVADALGRSNVDVGAAHGIHRQVVAALVAERLDEAVAVDTPREIVVTCAGGHPGGSLIACDAWEGAVVDAYEGPHDPRLRARSEATPGLIVHTDMANAAHLRMTLGSGATVRVHPTALLGWLADMLPACARAFLAGHPRRRVPGMREALHLAARQPLALSIGEAARLREARIAMPEVARFADARSGLMQAFGRGAGTREAYARWGERLDRGISACFAPVTGPLSRLAESVFGDAPDLPVERWATARDATLAGLAPGRAGKAILNHVIDSEPDMPLGPSIPSP